MAKAFPRVLLVTPPLVQANAPYPATSLLTAFLRREGVDTVQADLSLALLLRLFSRAGLENIGRLIRQGAVRSGGPSAAFFLENAERYAATITPVVRFLQKGGGTALARRILSHRYLPEGPRFRVLDELRAFGVLNARIHPTLQARFLASLYIDDIADVIREGVDPRFALSRYDERLSAAAPSFTPLRRALRDPGSFVDAEIEALTDQTIARAAPDVVGITIPFPGSVYAAFRIAQRVKRIDAGIRTVAGGGFVSTEWRRLADPRVFDYFDFLVYDDGEVPMLRIVEQVAGRRPRSGLLRTRLRTGGAVSFVGGIDRQPLRHRDRPAPTYAGLPLKRYFGMVETLNPMGRLWVERRWNRLLLAHGCYWHRCAFCDTCLDYIARFDPADAATVVRWMEALIDETGSTDFHFVDEAAPPALLVRLSRALLARGLRLAWWTNIRFEPYYTAERARLLARAGCIGLTGGIECAEDRLLRRMHKGITLGDVTRACRALAEAGIQVHAYLMYGFPGQTQQQTVDGLEFVRQLFRQGWLHSAYWHRFALTVHSGIYKQRETFGVRIPTMAAARFARNEVPFTDGTRTDHEALGRALHAAVYNFSHGVGLNEEVRCWFPGRCPRPRLAPDAAARLSLPSFHARRTAVPPSFPSKKPGVKLREGPRPRGPRPK